MTAGSHDLVIRGATLVTCDPEGTVLADAAVAIRGEKIDWIGPTALAPASARRVIEARDRILMPGLVNLHCHAADSLFRGLVEDLPLEPWLQTVWKAERAILTEETCELGARLGFAELLLSGVTTVMDMFWHPEATVRAAKALGIRVATGGIFFDFPGMDGHGAERRRADAEAFAAAHAGDPTVFVGTLPHGTYTVGPAGLADAFAVAEAAGGFFSTHAAETRAEQDTVTGRYGRSVIRHLGALGLLSPRTVLAHCVHVDAEEIAAMAASGTTVAHNPLSNLKLASGFAPVPAMLEAGVNVALGTDGAISGNDIDLWLAMRLAATLHKAVTGDATAVSPRQALAMATTAGARALGASDRIGSIEVGKQADLVLVATDRVHAAPLFDPVAHLVFAAGRADVTDVLVAGRPVVEAGRLLTADVPALLADVHALKARTLASIGRT
ncbi:amidohydrolase family protein [Oharaeibacter diazotrophicus]|uniref:5-methylthioadenosine/S-adenosylhomocysteine deaminase n=1 Tax=Oharaeibacter diazotrophicus TaxID=1920512 RepID=A0A4R6RG30_9HYPH|nr:amidohydrolase [Oharaeibacter diazotrophicus]TDP85174.1 5-methylthioadenosine/S-adenosylhomocysteine deaminase [Oharaeibacter diazotrophicus]BBE74144.1 atrazine chlorohydrolase [Pleomorphomonas sp. SM30]GLS76168.1 N-ethylammeline chlorohydrolase [Oharaeibacter diazotrophicus]